MLTDDELDDQIRYYKRLIYETHERHKAQCEAECELYDIELVRLEELKTTNAVSHNVRVPT